MDSNQKWPFRSKERRYQNQTFSVRIDVIILPTFSMSSLLVCLPVENLITLLWISGSILNKKIKYNFSNIILILTPKQLAQMKRKLLSDKQHRLKISLLISIMGRFVASISECRPWRIIKTWIIPKCWWLTRRVFGKTGSAEIHCTSEHIFFNIVSRWSLVFLIFSEFLSKLTVAISAAAPRPAIIGVFSVPARIPFSWPPPRIIGFKFAGSAQYNAPIRGP